MFENKLNSKWGYCKKSGGIYIWRILDFRMEDFECSPRAICRIFKLSDKMKLWDAPDMLDILRWMKLSPCY